MASDRISNINFSRDFLHPEDAQIMEILRAMRSAKNRETVEGDSSVPVNWSDCFTELSQADEDPTFFVNARSALASLDKMHATLQSVARCLDRRKDFLQSRIDNVRGYVYQRGIHTLPDELLARVLELCVDDNIRPTNGKTSINLSHVSRRFRCLALRLPLLWSRVSNTQSKHETETFLSRSRNYEFSVRLVIDDSVDEMSNERTEDFLKIVCPLHRHWKTFRLYCDFFSESRENINLLAKFAHSVRSHCQFTDLPSLISLSLISTAYATAIFPEVGGMDFFTRWNLPSIQKVELEDIFTDMSFGNSLKTLQICICEGFAGDMAEVFRLLQNNSGIVTLELYTESTLDGISDHHPMVQLQNLRNLTICASEPDVFTLMDHLKIPCVSQLALTPRIMQGTCIRQDWLADIVRPNDYSLLQEFSLEIEHCLDNGEDYQDGLIGTIFSKFTNLRHLCLSVPNTPYPELDPGTKVPFLRTLKLKGCDLLGQVQFLWLLKKNFAETKALDGFEKLEIQPCATLSEERLHVVFPKDKAVWKDAKDLAILDAC